MHPSRRSGPGSGQVTVYGKGGKTRVVLLSTNTWTTLAEIRGEAAPDAPVFRSRKGGPLDASQVHRIVKAAAKRAASRLKYRRIGYATLMRATVSTGARRSILCSKPSGTPRWPPRAATCTPAPPTAQQGTSAYERGAGLWASSYMRSCKRGQGMTGQPRSSRARAKAQALPLDRPEPSPREQEAISAARRRRADRSPRLTLAGTQKGKALNIHAPHSDDPGWGVRLHEAFGTTSPSFAARSLDQLGSSLRQFQQPQTTSDLNVGLAVVDGLKPENEIEAMLAIQMAATHDAAMTMLARAKHDSLFERASGYGNLATKLLRTFTAQAEALAKLRRGGEQKVTVEHVHVHGGGQAIVGSVEAGGWGGIRQSKATPMHRPSSMHLSPRCGAKTRRGSPCRSPAMPNGRPAPSSARSGADRAPARPPRPGLQAGGRTGSAARPGDRG